MELEGEEDLEYAEDEGPPLEEDEEYAPLGIPVVRSARRARQDEYEEDGRNIRQRHE